MVGVVDGGIAMTFWTAMRAHFVPVVQTTRLPASSIERYETAPRVHSPKALINVLRALSPIATQTAERTLDEGGSLSTQFTQKMPNDRGGRGLLARAQAPPEHS